MINQTLTGLFCIDVNLRKFPARSLEDFRHGASGIFGTEPRGFAARSTGLIFRRFMIIMMAEGYAI